MGVLEKQIGENMDHDLIILDGKSVFHAMGQIKRTEKADCQIWKVF